MLQCCTHVCSKFFDQSNLWQQYLAKLDFSSMYGNIMHFLLFYCKKKLGINRLVFIFAKQYQNPQNRIWKIFFQNYYLGLIHILPRDKTFFISFLFANCKCCDRLEWYGNSIMLACIMHISTLFFFSFPKLKKNIEYGIYQI